MGFYLYKGLKKPLVFFGLKGKYIFSALGVIVGGVIAALILSKFGLLGSLIGLALTGGGVYLIFRRQVEKTVKLTMYFRSKLTTLFRLKMTTLF